MADLNFAALNAGAAAMPAAVQRTTDVYDTLLQNAKVSDAMVKANPDLEQRMGMSPGQFSTLSAQQKIAATTGYIKNQGAQEMLQRIATEKAQGQEATARAGYFQEFGKERAAQAQMQSQDDQGAANYAQALDQQINNPDPNNRQAVAFAKSVPQGVKFQIHAAAQTGRTDPRTGAALTRPLMNYFSGPGGQGGTPTTPEPIKDAQGNVIASPAPNGKGGFTWIKAGKAAPSTVKITDNSDPTNPTILEMPLDEAEKRGYIKPPVGGSAPAGTGSAGAGAPGMADASAGAPPAAKIFTDKSGTQWQYTGNAADPTTDTNQVNWAPAAAAAATQ